MTDEPTPARRSREELRALVMEAAIDLIRREGLGVVSTTLGYRRVFDHLEATTGVRVTRASVHERIWQSQDDFQLDVLLHSNHPDLPSRTTLRTALDAYERTTAMSPWDRMREITRAVAPEALESTGSDPLYYSWVGMTMSMAKAASVEPGKRKALAESATSAYEEIDGRIHELLTTLADLLGLRPRTDLFGDAERGWRLIVRLGVALAEGVTLRTRFDPAEMPDEELATGPDGELQQWSGFALGYWALLQTLLEVDPEVHPDLADRTY